MDFRLNNPRFQLKYLGAALPLAIIFLGLGIGRLLAALLCILVAVISSFIYSGVEISPDHTKIRDYTDIIGWRIGAWRPMPVVSRLTVRYFSELGATNASNSSWGVWKESSANKFEKLVIMLGVENSTKGIIIGRAPVDQLQPVMKKAQEVADALGVAVHLSLPDALAATIAKNGE